MMSSTCIRMARGSMPFRMEMTGLSSSVMSDITDEYTLIIVSVSCARSHIVELVLCCRNWQFIADGSSHRYTIQS